MSQIAAAPIIPQRGIFHRLLTRLGFREEDRIVDETLMLALTRGNTGGLLKRIDENRELLETLRSKCPTVLYENHWIEGWVGANDSFFTALQAILRIPANERPVGFAFPRPWPLPAASQPSDELAVLREAVEILGFDSQALAHHLMSPGTRASAVRQLEQLAESREVAIDERWGR